MSIVEADCKLGDKVILWMTGETTKYVAECIATKDEPGKAPEHDVPRFKVTGKFDAEGKVTPESLIGNMVLKPGDYILLERYDG